MPTTSRWRSRRLPGAAGAPGAARRATRQARHGARGGGPSWKSSPPAARPLRPQGLRRHGVDSRRIRTPAASTVRPGSVGRGNRVSQSKVNWGISPVGPQVRRACARLALPGGNRYHLRRGDVADVAAAGIVTAAHASPADTTPTLLRHYHVSARILRKPNRLHPLRHYRHFFSVKDPWVVGEWW